MDFKMLELAIQFDLGCVNIHQPETVQENETLKIIWHLKRFTSCKSQNTNLVNKNLSVSRFKHLIQQITA